MLRNASEAFLFLLIVVKNEKIISILFLYIEKSMYICNVKNNKIMLKYNKNTFIYLGLFLNESVRAILTDVAITHMPTILFKNNCKMHLSHLTLLFKSDVNTEKGQNIIKMAESFNNSPVSLKIIEIGSSDKCMAFKIEKTPWLEKYCMNATPHITICTYNDGKPVDSNRITDWKKIEPVYCTATMKMFNK